MLESEIPGTLIWLMRRTLVARILGAAQRGEVALSSINAGPTFLAVWGVRLRSRTPAFPLSYLGALPFARTNNIVRT